MKVIVNGKSDANPAEFASTVISMSKPRRKSSPLTLRMQVFLNGEMPLKVSGKRAELTL